MTTTTIETAKNTARVALNEMDSLSVWSRGPAYEPEIPAEKRAAYDAARARYAAACAIIDAYHRDTAYTCPETSADTFLAGLPLLDSLSEDE